MHRASGAVTHPLFTAMLGASLHDERCGVGEKARQQVDVGRTCEGKDKVACGSGPGGGPRV